MKKNLILIIAFLCIASGAMAQNTFLKGDKVLNLGLGIGSTLYSGSYYTGKTPPISASYEVGVKDELFDSKSSLGIGGYVGYTAAKWEYDNWGWKYSSFILGVRGILHYQLVDKFDTYTGLMLGYNIVTSKEFGTAVYGYDYSSSSSGIAYSWFLGGRYYFNDKFAGMVELGYGIAYLNLGVSVKF
ncbi:MAG TPA: hypothetical protein VJ963_00295 [Bacteroidales bacterium]|nr:hypothetical protein [Bacteroidales bacterium]